MCPSCPTCASTCAGRHALIVVRGFDYKEDLQALRSYIAEVQAGVDRRRRRRRRAARRGADARHHHRRLRLGDHDGAAVRRAQLIVHAYAGGKAPGAERLEELGLAFDLFEGTGTSEDIAMLLAYEKGADLLVAVGTHASMIEFLDKGRSGMASTFLVRLRVGRSPRRCQGREPPLSQPRAHPRPRAARGRRPLGHAAHRESVAVVAPVHSQRVGAGRGLMVNFRFHIVSIVAVFLALGIGVLVGATVVDQGAVQLSEATLRNVTQERTAAHAQVRDLRNELGVWDTFAEQARGGLLAGRLADVPVLVVAVDGVEQRVVDDLRGWVRTAGAVDEGALWLGDKLDLDSADDVAALGGLLTSSGSSAPILRGELVGRLAATFAVAAVPATPPAAAPGEPSTTTTTAPPAAPTGEFLVALRGGGFVRYDAPDDDRDLLSVPRAGTRLVLVSSAGAHIPSGELPLPLVRGFAQAGALVVAAEPAPDEGKRSGLVGAVRTDPVTAARIATVDGVDEFFGQVAVVLALADAAAGRIGHYGTASDAQSLLPVPPPG